MLLGFKTQLKINKSFQVKLFKHAGTARHACNWGLGLTKQIADNNKANPQEKIKFPSAINLHKRLVASVKPNNSWYYEVSKCVPQYALKLKEIRCKGEGPYCCSANRCRTVP